MVTASSNPLPRWFRPVVLVAILWNAFGVIMYLSSIGMFGDPAAGLSEADRAAASSIPASIMGAFAIGTFAGLIGSLGLFFRQGWVVPVLIVSLIALLMLEGWIIFLSGALASFGLAVPVMVSAGAVLLAWLAIYARRNDWLA